MNALHLTVLVNKWFPYSWNCLVKSQLYLGLKGMAPNKAILYHLIRIMDIKIMVANLHLPHGNKNKDKRF